MRLRLFPAATVAVALALGAFGSYAGADDRYLSVQITRPANEDTIHDNQGRLEVEVDVLPPLDASAGDRLLLVFDGAVVARTGGRRFGLSAVPRGAHTLEAEVRDGNDRTLIRSAPVTVHMWQASQLFPSRKKH